ncbi:MAG: tyrosine recombinase [Chloroflexota bacterium]|jgi:integrase/recombinase XerD
MEDQLLAFLNFLSNERNYSDNTIAAYRNDLSQFLDWLEENHPEIHTWATISYPIVSDYSDVLKQKSYTASSVARKVAAIKSFFHFLLARGFINSDPTANLDSPKVKKRLPQTLSSEEVERLLEAPSEKDTPKNLRDSALLHVLYATGMRVTEAVSLQVEDVNLPAKMISFQGKEDRLRELPIDQETHDILVDYLENGRPHLVKDKSESALFLNHRGKQLTRQGLWLIIKAYAEQAGLGDKVTPHTLRHSFAAHRLSSGTELREVQQLLGHANISTTQIYSQLYDEQENADG